MTKAIYSLVSFLLFTTVLLGQSGSPAYEFRNGNWYNGTGFEAGSWYSVGGKLTKKAPAKIDSVIDLAERWVVPPLGDAFCSSLSGNPSAEQQLSFYLAEGVFYLQVLGNTQEGRKDIEALVKQNNTADIAFANGGITCMLGYPFLKIEGPAQGIRNPRLMAEKYGEIKEGRKMLGDGYWFVDSKAGVNKIWDSLKKQNPNVLSIYLLDAKNSGGKESKGLSPAVAKAVVKKARRSKLRVFAHVETADDVRLGLSLGVAGFANLPGHNWDGSGDGSKYKLSDQDLKKMAKKKTVVIPLFSHAQTQTPRPGAREAQAKLLKRLMDSGVNVAIGSDDIQRTIRGEVNYWFQFGDLDYAQALKILCVNTPKAIFPKRKIGKFAEGYEASFLVLRDNPLQNLLKLRATSFKVRNGLLIE